MGEVKRRTLYFTAPRQVEIREDTLPTLGADDVLVETICSAISAGTEMLVYRGRFPRELEADAVISSLRGEFKYPLAYGYACVGVVKETGSQADKSWRDRLVFAFQPHTSHFLCQPDSLFPIPASLSPDSACFLPNMETAVNLVQDGAPLFGERVLVLGQGVVGLLTASLLNEFPLDVLVTADCFPLRCDSSPVAGRFAFDPHSPGFRQDATRLLKQGADLTFELSGNPEALNDALALTAFSGRIVIGSWYGEKPAEIDLGGKFHRSRIQLISSQVSTLAPELSGRWDKARRFDSAWKALERIKPEKWITHRFAIDDAAEAYHLLDERPQETIQVVFDYK
ncbi:MAG TPA: zinc-binding alcohol dehydrogenase [Anaerolineales bacterium]|nr:zinc-binding alcohol dehydrogenase [Anaerolineales bacterium]